MLNKVIKHIGRYLENEYLYYCVLPFVNTALHCKMMSKLLQDGTQLHVTIFLWVITFMLSMMTTASVIIVLPMDISNLLSLFDFSNQDLN